MWTFLSTNPGYLLRYLSIIMNLFFLTDKKLKCIWLYQLLLQFINLYYAATWPCVLYFHVAGVGYKNSLRLTMNSTVEGVPVKYRVFISETGTTVSKVGEDSLIYYLNTKLACFPGLFWCWPLVSGRADLPSAWHSLCTGRVWATLSSRLSYSSRFWTIYIFNWF